MGIFIVLCIQGLKEDFPLVALVTAGLAGAIYLVR